jgi:hypothetical protein
MLLQVVCDSKLLITDVHTGWPGSVHDARVFRSSPIYQLLTDTNIPPEYHLLGDSAYPLQTFVLVPYRDNGHLSNVQIKYNKIHSSTRVAVERTIGLLKCKWRRLKYLDMSLVEEIPTIITACCVLHNIVLMTDQYVDEDEHDTDPDMGPADDNSSQQNGNSQAENKRRQIAQQLL